MSADLTKPFDPSCCEGGTGASAKSAQPCGCDPGENYRCRRHTIDISEAIKWSTNGGQIVNIVLEDPLEKHYREVVLPCWNFAGRLQTPEQHQQNALIGLTAEAGETLDIGKKMWFHTLKPFEFFREKLLSELGDIIYYWLRAVNLFGFTAKEVLDYNRKKLESRHPEMGKVKERFGKDAIKG